MIPVQLMIRPFVDELRDDYDTFMAGCGKTERMEWIDDRLESLDRVLFHLGAIERQGLEFNISKQLVDAVDWLEILRFDIERSDMGG